MPKGNLAKAALALLALALAWPSPRLASQGAGQPEGEVDATDVVVLLDVSQSVLPYFQDVTDYVVSSVVEDYLRYGDTFHLLSFGETAQSEIAQRMSSEADVKSVLGRLYLLYPLARHSDLVGALSYLHQYLADLPVGRRKIVVVITDGVHNPPPTSPSFGMAPEKVVAEIESAAARIRANGWPVRIIKLPFPKPGEPGAPSAGAAEAQGKSYLDAVASALGAEVSEFSADAKVDIARKSLSLAEVEFPGPLGKRDYAFSFPLRLRNGSGSAVGFELDRVRLGDADILAKRSFLTLQAGKSGTIEVSVLLPDSTPLGESRLELRVHFANGVRVSPDSGILELRLERDPLSALLRSSARVALFAVLLFLGLAAALAVVLMLRRMPQRAAAPIAAAVLRAEPEATKPPSGPIAAAPAPRASSPIPSAAALAASRREEAARGAALLATAAASANAALPATDASTAAHPEAARPSGKAQPRGRKIFKRKEEAHDAQVEISAAALLSQKRAEAERTVALLAEASGRRVPAAAASAADQARARARAAAYVPKVVKPGTLRIELLVAEQNPHIGLRNVHSLGAGGSKSIGGGSSDFLVFLVRVPRRAAELHFDGEKLSFVPLRPELFPELSGPVEDCLDKEIPMISRSGYPLSLRFAKYERPADKINKLLHCIETLGLVDGRE